MVNERRNEMKKILYIFSAILFLWGCEKNEDINNSRQDDVLTEEVQGTELPEVLYASVVIEQDTVTRTYVGGANRDEVLWQDGDAISFFSVNTHNARYDYAGEGGTTSVELVKDETKPGATGSYLLKSQAVYPYNENVTVVYNEEQGVDEINLTYPTTMQYGVNSFGKDANIMVAAGKSEDDDKLYFRNACGYLLIKLYGAGTTVKSVTLSSVSGTDKIAGSAVVVASNDAAPVITMADDASTAVTLDCSNGGKGVALGVDAEHATEFWFCLPPVTFTDGIKITVTDMNGDAYTKQTSKTVNITRNDVLPMAALEFNTNAPAATKLWYTRADNSTAPISLGDKYFNASIKSHKWDGSKFVVEFNAPLKTIKSYAFEDSTLGTITLPEGVTTIEESAFEDSTLSEITIPGSVENIGEDVFWGCSNLHSVTFLPSATKTPLKIGRMSGAYNYGPFYDTSLNSIDLNRELILVKSDGSNFTQSEWWHGMFATEKAEDGDIQSASVTLGPQVETISDYMFYYLPIESLTIPGTVTTIGKGAFMGTGITKLIIPANVTSIGDDAFKNCTQLSEVVFEDSATSITMGYQPGVSNGWGDGPFYQSPLKKIVLKREVVLDVLHEYVFTKQNTADAGLFATEHYAQFPATGGVEIGGNVKTILPYMFGNLPITSLTIPETVTTIREYALSGIAITKLEIPGSVTEIKDYAFYNCTALEELRFEYSSTPLTLGFQDWTDELGPFYQSPLKYIKLDRDIVYNTDYAASCDGWDEGAFSNKYYSSGNWTARVIIGEQVTTLPKYMFATMRMTELHIPSNVVSIGKGVVDECAKLDAVVFYGLDATEVPTLEEDAFAEPAQIKDAMGYFVMWKYYLFIPKKDGCKDIYLGKTGWSGLGDYLFSSSPTNANEIEKFYKYQDYEWYRDRYHHDRNPLPPTE